MKKIAILLAAPSGGGKRTLTEHVLQKFPQIEIAISATTRSKRPTETEGVQYNFVSRERFLAMRDDDELIEWNEHFGNYYAAQKSEADRIWGNDNIPLFELEVNGVVNAKKYFGDKAHLVFIDVPSLDVLEERLRARGTEDDEKIAERLKRADYERSFRDMFDYVVMNDDLDTAKKDMEKVIRSIISEAS